ncbi:MAG: 2-oxoglutarate ferredoxin oxidoreductase subunit beta [Rhodospirillaceae bacterium]|nr:MAG: 2-oxoglutarate ferredoxin oxidoreductase subunit beta [Rhodospirillaceae bacterium]
MNAPVTVRTARVTPRDYKSDLKPVWCPGCGHYSVLAAITRALADMELPREMTTILSGIGCSSRLPAYTSAYGFHGVHGRVLPTATGLKLARPDLTVIAVGGDGDGYSIGGNHFIHACRRNVDLTYVVMDNAVYGMTKGQASPTTEPHWDHSKLTPHGSGVAAFRPLEMALSAGATFIARGFAGKPNDVTRMIVEGIRHPGFAFIEVLSPCVTYRPEQSTYKGRVHKGFGSLASTRREAFIRLLDDDGFALGILFKNDTPPFQIWSESNVSLDDIAQTFRAVKAVS